jgi:hypothetical protein
MASTSASACSESFLLAAVSWMASGIPRASQIRWRLLPSFARSDRIGTRQLPPKTARIEQLSTIALDQSIREQRESQSSSAK